MGVAGAWCRLVVGAAGVGGLAAVGQWAEPPGALAGFWPAEAAVAL
ncbi:hypothetical protein SNARM312S_01777 [Streptomyces narbonensis]